MTTTAAIAATATAAAALSLVTVDRTVVGRFLLWAVMVMDRTSRRSIGTPSSCSSSSKAGSSYYRVVHDGHDDIAAATALP
jgi:hypothetical protein